MASLPAGHEVEFVSRPPTRLSTPADRFELRASSSSSTAPWDRGAPCCSSRIMTTLPNNGLLLIDPKVLEATTVAALRESLAGRHSCHRRSRQRAGDRRLRGRTEGPSRRPAIPASGSSTPR